MLNRQLKQSQLEITAIDYTHSLWLNKHQNLPLHFSERKLLLAVVDLLAVNSALMISLTARPDFKFDFYDLWFRFPWFLFINAIWMVSGVIFNIYDLKRAARLTVSLPASFFVIILTLVIYKTVPFLAPEVSNQGIESAVLLGLTFAGVVSWRVFYARVLVSPNFQTRALVIGAGHAGRTLAAELYSLNHKESGATGYHLVGFIDDDYTKHGAYIENIRVLGTSRDLVQVVKRLHPDVLIIAITRRETIDPQLFEAILRCREMGTAVTTMSEVYEQLTGRVPVEHTGRTFDTVMPLAYPATRRIYRGLQRLLDMGVSSFGCLIVLLVIPVIWLSNRICSPGPLFYRQERVGQSGKVFSIVKFRSMRVDAEKLSGAVWASVNDARITPVGQFLRKTRLDEIPQFWNILKGDMSLIGPRPERPLFVKQLEEKLPFYRLRHAVKPGLTGWAQVEYRYASCLEDSLVKLQYDIYYIKHQGLLLDFKITLKTIRVVLGFKGR
ncbi:MAG TPA: sugar transferase [Chloroflexia bacterium]|nr:sugar transferase [Chloroflexia bacterium]